MMKKDSSIPLFRTRKFKAILLLSVGLILLIVAGMMNDVLTPVLIGFLLAYIFEPLLLKLEKFRIRRIFGVVCIYLLLFLALILAASALVPKLASQTASLYRNISTSTIRFGLGLSGTQEEQGTSTNGTDQASSETESTAANDNAPPTRPPDVNVPEDDSWVNKHLGLSLEESKELVRKHADKLANKIAGIFSAIIQKAGQGVTNMIGFIFNTMLALVFAFFFMLHFKDIKRTIRRYIPAANRQVTLRVVRKIDGAVSNFFRGRLLVCLIAGGVSSVGFLLSGLDYWLILGLAAGILGFIPIIGVIITLVPACAFAMLTPHPLGSLVGVAITFTVVQAVVEPLVGTLIISHEVKIHPVAIIIALLVGGHLFGTFGMIISIPMAATIKILTEEFIIPPLAELAED